jgi:hypothetical protein
MADEIQNNPAPEPTPTIVAPAAPTPSAPVVDSGQTEKLLNAKLALEGEAWTKKRQEREKASVLIDERNKLNTRLQEIAKLKTDLEINWVELDNKRRDLKIILDPILKKEEEIEARKAEVENTERTTGLPKEKEAVEKKRWLIEDELRTSEQAKWEQQEKLWKLEEAIEAATKQYRSLLDDEDKIHQELDKIEKDLPVT